MACHPCLPAGRARQAGGQVRFLQILHGVLMHFVCHETNNFFLQISRPFLFVQGKEVDNFLNVDKNRPFFFVLSKFLDFI
jgi:hypothetical protein